MKIEKLKKCNVSNAGIALQVYAPTTSHSDEETTNFYNTIDNILEKQIHYTIVIGDSNGKVGGQTNTS